MSQAIVMRTMFARLRFTNAEATEMVDNQGIDSLDEFKILTDDECSRLCKVIQQPGGYVANRDYLALPTANRAATVADRNISQYITNHGISILQVDKNSMKLGAYFIQHQDRISRTCVIDTLTLAAVHGMKDLKDSEDNYTDPTELPTIDEKVWPRTMESICEYLFGHLGVTKVPLSYFVHDDIDPPNADDGRIRVLLKKLRRKKIEIV